MEFNLDNRNWLLIRSVLYLLLFILLHFLYDLLPNPVFAIFSGTSESVFQHAKISFYCYLILVLIELVINRKNIDDVKQSIFPGLLTAIIIPWIMFLCWFVLPSFWDRMEPIIVEIIYANVATFFVGFIGSVLHKAFREIKYLTELLVLIIVLLCIEALEFTIFTFRIPWYDFFHDPLA